MTNEIRVLHVFSDPSFGIWTIGTLARRQKELGYKVEFACFNGEFLDDLRLQDIPINLIPITRRMLTISHFIAIFRLWKLFMHRKYHIVHTHTPTASVLACIAASLAKIPIVISHMRTSWWESTTINRVTFTIVELLCGKLISHIITINCMDAHDVATYGIKQSKDITCLHCGGSGVDIHRFDPSQINDKHKKILRKEYNITENDIVIGFIGRLIHEKGIDELLTSFMDIVKTYNNTKLLLVGDVLKSDPDKITKKKIIEIIFKNNLKNNIILTGFRTDIPKIISIMDILVLPSYREGFGMVLAEAGAMGRPVISTKTRGGLEAVTPGENGILVPIGDSLALRDAILKLILDKQLRLQMGITGRKIALERFNEDVIFQKIQAIYKNLFFIKGLQIPDEQSNLKSRA